MTHVHSKIAARCCPDEPRDDVLAKLKAMEPVWEPHKHDDTCHAKTGETRIEFDKRRALWEMVQKRESGRG